jgi:GrpB-like predicted nucleotidyltransferase (UPF0157 family)
MDADEVVVVDYQRVWPDLFEMERRQIVQLLGPRVGPIEHIGSTAVPGLPAKPIIDLMAGLVGSGDLSPLGTLGYEDLGENGITGRRFFRKGRPRTHHLHVIETDSHFWKEHLCFRDFLRLHPDEAEAYDRLKRALSENYRHNRDAYSRGKMPLIEEILRKASRNGPR